MEAREFGEYIKSLRKSKKMTIRQLELYSGVSNAYISQIERGLRDIPSPDILEKLSKHLGVDHDDLMRKAGYIETAEALDKMNSFLYKFADSVTLDKDAIRAINKEQGYEDFEGVYSLRDILKELDLSEKLELLMVVTDNFNNLIYVPDEGSSGGTLELGTNKISADLEDNSVVDYLNLSYKGMELTREEKIEFLSIARAIFDARRALKGKD